MALPQNTAVQEKDGSPAQSDGSGVLGAQHGLHHPVTASVASRRATVAANASGVQTDRDRRSVTNAFYQGQPSELPTVFTPERLVAAFKTSSSPCSTSVPSWLTPTPASPQLACGTGALGASTASSIWPLQDLTSCLASSRSSSGASSPRLCVGTGAVQASPVAVLDNLVPDRCETELSLLELSPRSEEVAFKLNEVLAIEEGLLAKLNAAILDRKDAESGISLEVDMAERRVSSLLEKISETEVVVAQLAGQVVAERRVEDGLRTHFNRQFHVDLARRKSEAQHLEALTREHGQALSLASAQEKKFDAAEVIDADIKARNVLAVAEVRRLSIAVQAAESAGEDLAIQTRQLESSEAAARHAAFDSLGELERSRARFCEEEVAYRRESAFVRDIGTRCEELASCVSELNAAICQNHSEALAEVAEATAVQLELDSLMDAQAQEEARCEVECQRWSAELAEVVACYRFQIDELHAKQAEACAGIAAFTSSASQAGRDNLKYWRQMMATGGSNAGGPAFMRASPPSGGGAFAPERTLSARWTSGDVPGG